MDIDKKILELQRKTARLQEMNNPEYIEAFVKSLSVAECELFKTGFESLMEQLFNDMDEAGLSGIYKT